MKTHKTHILMTGGGTLGPVTPLISIAQEWRKRDQHALVSWIGTPAGPERMIVEEAGFPFYPLFAPKLDRGKKWLWPFVPLLFLYSFIRSFLYLKKMRPGIIFSAGGYVSIPVVYAGRLLGIPSWIHQLDATPGIANKVMSHVATRISVTWGESLSSFPESKTIHVGSLVRQEVSEADAGIVFEKFPLDRHLPTVFVVGGGTGAQSINEAMAAIGEDIIEKANVIHLTGLGKMLPELKTIHERYIALEIMGKEILHCYAAADVVVSRAGMGTIMVLSALGKPTIFLPLANADQLANAKKIEDAEAGMMIYQMNGQILRQEILHLLDDATRRRLYAGRIHGLFLTRGEEKIVEEAERLLNR